MHTIFTDIFHKSLTQPGGQCLFNILLQQPVRNQHKGSMSIQGASLQNGIRLDDAFLFRQIIQTPNAVAGQSLVMVRIIRIHNVQFFRGRQPQQIRDKVPGIIQQFHIGQHITVRITRIVAHSEEAELLFVFGDSHTVTGNQDLSLA